MKKSDRIRKRDYKRLEKMEEEYTVAVKQHKEMVKRVDLANKSMLVMVATLKTINELLFNNFNVLIKKFDGKLHATVSTFASIESVGSSIEGNSFQEILVKIAKNHQNFLSGGEELVNMFKENCQMSDEVKEAILKGALKI
jgi:hypothetical protein